MGCIVTITDKLNIKGSAGKDFSTEESFDSWLFENQKAIKRALKKNEDKLTNKPGGVSPTFLSSMTPLEERFSAFNSFRDSMQAMSRSKGAILGIDPSEQILTLGVTTFFRHAGNKNDIKAPVRSFSLSEKTEFIEYQRTKKGKTAIEAENEWNRVQKINALRRLDGTILGALIQDELTGTNKDISAILKKGKSKEKWNDLVLTGMTIDEAINRIKARSDYKHIAEEIKKELRIRHGKNCEIYTEFEVFSKEMSEELAKTVKTVSSKLYHKAANRLSGAIDILVRDEDGYVHSYDIKTSGETIENWWTQTGSNYKYDEVSAQQMANAIMAEQNGMKFTSVNIIPINENLDNDGNIIELKSENFQTFGLTNDYAKFLYKHFPISPSTNSQSITTLASTVEELYPGIGLDTAAQTRQINKDFIMDKKAHKNSDGKWHLLPDTVFPEWKQFMVKNEIVFNTKAEMEEFVTNEYVPKMNEGYSKELLGFANDLQRITKSNRGNKIDLLRESARGISKDKQIQNFIVNKFKKFVLNNWSLVSDSENRLAEYGIFIFTKGSFAEVIMIDKTDLTAEVKLGNAKNTTILGNLKHDLSKGADDINILKSYRGNLMLMKAMIYISQNPNVFRNYKIQAVRAINIRWGQEIDENTDKLLDNWNTLCALYNIRYQGIPNKTKLRTLGREQFLSGPAAYVQRAEDLVELIGEKSINFKGHRENIEANQNDTEDEILRYMRNLLASENDLANSDSWGAYSEKKEAYMYLYKALLGVRGWTISVENDKGPFFSDGVFIAGTESLSPAESTSSTIRIFNQIQTTYEHKVRDLFIQVVRPWQDQMVKVYEENGIDNLFGNERNFFRNCFEQEEGKITSDFVLIPPDENPFLNERPELKKLVEMFLEVINEQRFPDKQEREQLKSIPRSMYYQVPLTETGFKSQVVQDGLWNALKRNAKNVFTEVQNYAYGAPMSSLEIKRYNDLDREEVYDPYLDTSEDAQLARRQYLNGTSVEVDNKVKKEYGVGAFEVNLDIVFLKAMASALRQQASREYMPLFTGLRMILEFNRKQNGIQTPEIAESIDKFIKSSVFGQLIIKPSNQTIYHILNLLKGIASKVTLGLNTVSFAREMISSTLRTSVSLVNDKYMSGQFTAKDYLDAMEDVILHAHENIDVRSKYMQSNVKFGLANVSMEQLAKASKSNFLNPANWEEDLLFENTTMPDFVHRNALLWAFLKKRGSADAYEMVDGVLTYKMEKDKAYEVFLKYRNNFDAIPDRKTKEEYIHQRQMYEMALDDWNKHYGYNLEYGDDLPEAITLTEANGIRVYADHLYGNYDQNTKSLLQKSLLGSIFLQFKTFQLAQFLQDVRGKGNINITTLHHMETEDGKKIYRKPKKENIGTEGVWDYFTEDQLKNLSDEDMKDVVPFMMFTGSPVIGRFYSDLSIAYNIMFNPNQALEDWKHSDVYKANLYTSLFNNIGMLLIAMLLRLIYKEPLENEEEQTWWTKWTYTVLMGVANDGPIAQTLSGLVNGTPPAFSILRTFIKNAQSIITDEDPAIIGFMKLFGATRSFVGTISQ